MCVCVHVFVGGAEGCSWGKCVCVCVFLHVHLVFSRGPGGETMGCTWLVGEWRTHEDSFLRRALRVWAEVAKLIYRFS